MNELDRLRKETKNIDLKELKQLEIENFDKHTDLKRRLISYIKIQYEGDAIIDEKHLLMEFKSLKNSNKLSELFKGGRY